MSEPTLRERIGLVVGAALTVGYAHGASHDELVLLREAAFAAADALTAERDALRAQLTQVWPSYPNAPVDP